jgi:SAM-dependent methyltransferase
LNSSSPFHWYEISENPDDESVLKWRRTKILDSRLRNVQTYKEFVMSNCERARVLDFGAANHSSQTTNLGNDFTHDWVAESARFVLAVDVVNFTRDPHSNCKYEVVDLLINDSREMLNEKDFDVLFAGNVLEHLSSPELFFSAAKDLVSDQGRLVVAVPNAGWMIGVYDMLRGTSFSLNVDHVNNFYPGSLIELASRSGWEVESWCYLGKQDMVKAFRPGNLFDKLFFGLWYQIARTFDLPEAHNQLGFTLKRANVK